MTKSKKGVPTLMSLDNAKRKGITQLKHHMKSYNQGLYTIIDRWACWDKQVSCLQPIEPKKRKGGKPDTINRVDSMFSNSTIQNDVKTEEDDDDEFCN